jgi:hypothetical protein
MLLWHESRSQGCKHIVQSVGRCLSPETGNEGRHAAYCDAQLEVAFLATLTNKSITIPSHSNAEVTNNTNNSTLTNTVACLADPTTNMSTSKNQGDGMSVDDSPKKRLRSSTRSQHITCNDDQDNDSNKHLFPSGGSVQSDNMMDITDYQPGMFHTDDNPTNRYIHQKQNQQLTERNCEQLVDHEAAQSYYQTPGTRNLEYLLPCE